MSISIKEQAIRAIEELPAGAGLDEVMERLYFLHKVERGLQQIGAGQVISHDEARRRLKRALPHIGELDAPTSPERQ